MQAMAHVDHADAFDVASFDCVRVALGCRAFDVASLGCERVAFGVASFEREQAAYYCCHDNRFAYTVAVVAWSGVLDLDNDVGRGCRMRHIERVVDADQRVVDVVQRVADDRIAIDIVDPMSQNNATAVAVAAVAAAVVVIVDHISASNLVHRTILYLQMTTEMTYFHRVCADTE